MKKHGVSERRACRVVGLCLATYRYRSRRGDGGVIRRRLHELAEERPRFGYSNSGAAEARGPESESQERLPALSARCVSGTAYNFAPSQ